MEVGPLDLIHCGVYGGGEAHRGARNTTPSSHHNINQGRKHEEKEKDRESEKQREMVREPERIVEDMSVICPAAIREDQSQSRCCPLCLSCSYLCGLFTSWVVYRRLESSRF